MANPHENKLPIAILFLPVVFTLHNLEEAIYMSRIKDSMFGALVFGQSQFIIAVTVFSVLGFLAIFGKRFYPNAFAYQYGVTGFAGMLFLNALFSHIFPIIYFRSYLPGMATALLLMLPLSGYVLRKIYQSRAFSTGRFIIAILSGGLAGMMLLAFLRFVL